MNEGELTPLVPVGLARERQAHVPSHVIRGIPSGPVPTLWTTPDKTESNGLE